MNVKPGRNDPCPCGSGKKYKKCCADKVEASPAFQPLRQKADAAVQGKAPTATEINQLAALFNAGRYAEVESRARILVGQYPESGFAWKALGAALLVQGKDALPSLQKAVEFWPEDAQAHSNLGNALRDLGRPDDAVASYRRALELRPDDVEVHSSLGNVLQVLGRLDDAVESYRLALELRPDYAEVHSNLGNALRDLGRLDEAVASCRRALELKPDYAGAHYNLGAILNELGRLREAEASYRRAIELRPDYAEAHYNLGNILKDMDRLCEAEASYRRALELKPNYAEAHSNLGNVLKDLERPDDAVASYRRAIELKPDYAEAHYNLGNTLKDQGRLDEAEASYRRALELKPDYAEAHLNLGNIFKDMGRLDEASASYRRALQIKPDYVDAHSNLIFALDLSDKADASELQREREKWGETYAAPLWRETAHPNDRAPERRLRVGYVSADFRDHSAAKAFGGMLTRYDRSQFEVFAYSNAKGEDRLTELFKQNATAWRNIAGLPDEAVEKTIREDGIDILVDLSGFSAGNRLLVFARKPAPIQITAWGYATSTGMRAMDVLFADPVMVPPEEKQYCTEEVRYLPNAMGAFFIDPFPDVNELPALSGGSITFGSLNRLAKITDKTCRAWAGILLGVPGSRLILKTRELDNTSVREQVAGHFTKAGVAAERIVMLGKTSWHEHMRTCHRIDIGLDPYPHGGGVTALEGLMMGVPVVTLRWPTMAGRASASIMTTLGLTDWIAETPEQYVELAVRKAGDLQSLAELRQRLRGILTTSAMGDPATYARAVEQEYRQLWREWCAKCTLQGMRGHPDLPHNQER